VDNEQNDIGPPELDSRACLPGHMFDMIAEAFDRAMKEVVVRRQAEARPDFEGIAGPTRFGGYAVQLQAGELDRLAQVSGEGT
jgi:hypothetical protein